MAKPGLLLGIMLFACALATAQDKKEHSFTDDIATTVRHTGRRIRKEVKSFNSIDTTFIEPQHYNFAFMVEHSTWYEHYLVGDLLGSHAQRLSFSPNLNTKLGLYFGWRWLFAGFAFDVGDLFGQNKNQSKKKELALNIYSSKFGIDMYYRHTGSDFKLRNVSGFDLDEPLESSSFKGMNSQIVGLNAYWIFNYKRFSYPAIYSQSTQQKRNAGSIIAGFSYSRHNVNFDPTLLPDPIQQQMDEKLKFNHVKYADYSLAAGYGYNWVLRKHLAANLSIMPGIGLKHSRIDDTPLFHHDWMNDINFDCIFRGGIVWNNAKYFGGLSVVMHSYNYHRPDFTLTNSFAVMRIYLGFNFLPRKRYAKE